jgi:hypothetical protein
LISVGSVVQIYSGPPSFKGAAYCVVPSAECRRKPALSVVLPYIPPARKHRNEFLRGISSAGRAPGLQPGGHRFEPGILHCLASTASGRRLGWGPGAHPRSMVRARRRMRKETLRLASESHGTGCQQRSEACRIESSGERNEASRRKRRASEASPRERSEARGRASDRVGFGAKPREIFDN